MIISTSTSSVIGIVFWVLIIVLCKDFTHVFTSCTIIINTVYEFAILLTFTILLNNVHHVLSSMCLFFEQCEWSCYSFQENSYIVCFNCISRCNTYFFYEQEKNIHRLFGTIRCHFIIKEYYASLRYFVASIKMAGSLCL